jgi:hypothetical protein
MEIVAASTRCFFRLGSIFFLGLANIPSKTAYRPREGTLPVKVHKFLENQVEAQLPINIWSATELEGAR